jgi:ADP-ribosyl-[dinitrogen reductase] hydrolase
MELDCAMRAAASAGLLLQRAFHAGESDVDGRAEKTIQGVLIAEFPQYGYHGEELGFVRPPQDPAGHLWLLDPDDGTAAFNEGFRGASVSIALGGTAGPFSEWCMHTAPPMTAEICSGRKEQGP